MKLLGLVLAVLALVFAVVSGMATGGNSAGLHEGKEKAYCGGGGGPGGPGGPPPPPPPPPTNATK